MVRIGFITIGQSPRIDVTNDILKFFPSGVEVLEVGALDGMSKSEVEVKFKPEAGETVYVTRMRDGFEVKISREKILPLMGECVKKLEASNVDVIGILCSGEFPRYKASIPIVYPEKVLKGFASGISYSGSVAVLIPAVEQLEYAKLKWSGLFEDLKVYAISPYTASLNDFRIIGEKLKANGVRLVVMDCIGYNLAQKNVLKSCGDFMILTARTALARAIRELIE